jgi:Tol biopolymer transport system component
VGWFIRPAVVAVTLALTLVAATFAANAANVASNDRIGFVLYRRGIFSMAGDGTQRRHVVHLVGRTGGPVWSPDGRQFLFVSGHHVKRPDRCDPHCPYAIYGANADGSAQRRLTPASANSGAPSWSPDGREIVFIMDNTLSLMDVNGRNVRPIPIRGAVGSPDWAADGHSIIFQSIDGIVLLDTHTPRKPYRVLVDGTEPLLSPDRRFVAYSDTSYGISVFDLATRTARKIARNDDMSYDPNVVWSPDSTQLAYVGVLPAKPPLVGMDDALFVVQRDGTKRRQLTPRYRAWESTAWSRARIYYSAKKSGLRAAVWSIKADGSARQKIAADGDQLAVQPHPR